MFHFCLIVIDAYSHSHMHPHHTNAQMVHYLLGQGARVDQSGERGRTALYWACNRVCKYYICIYAMRGFRGMDGEMNMRDIFAHTKPNLNQTHPKIRGKPKRPPRCWPRGPTPGGRTCMARRPY